MSAPRSTRVAVDGWIVLDKPVGLTSTHAVSRVKRVYNAKKGGHAGTLDPLASGILPIALGEATKTVPFVQDGEKSYRFTVKWGEETTTDDAEGDVAQRSDARPARGDVEALLPRFTGEILQTPPAFSAIKIDGERAYDIARDGETVELQPRPVTIHALRLVGHDGATTTLEADCGKGTYVRALARDLGRLLGCYGHVVELRRTRVGPFTLADATPLAALDDVAEVGRALKPVEAGLTEVPCVIVDRNGAARLRRGQGLLLRGRDAPSGGMAWAACGGEPVAFGAIEEGELRPSRVFNLGAN
ncbi:MAG: tRNA pseudouridine(55) synthase TruB [Methylobacteriaceae bacterium]|nr:tRNA pseudouridine(55) synthase TruB [Methylobacteriaceae bacterium]